jgi:hypothetical protein
MPELRVGTLDALLALSDDMVKTMTLVEGVTGKIRRQLAEVDRASAEVRRAWPCALLAKAFRGCAADVAQRSGRGRARGAWRRRAAARRRVLERAAARAARAGWPGAATRRKP